MIPTKPPPSFREPDRWSPEFIDFVSKCLIKNPEQRATAKELLNHEFIANAKSCAILQTMILDAKEILEAQHQQQQEWDEQDEIDASTMVKGEGAGTLVPGSNNDAGTMKGDQEPSDGTMIVTPSEQGTLVDSEL